MNTLKPFRATVSDRLLEKAPRFFDGTFDDIFAELFQNARRAGATCVLVEATTNDDGGGVVAIRDDGCGIEDPRSVLTLGGSDWRKDVQEVEDPAGAGCYSLASRGAAIRSRARGCKGWAMALETEHFEGAEDIRPVGADMDFGTEITIPYVAGEHPERATETAAEFFPLPVLFNGEPVAQAPFLKGAMHTENWRGLKIGVFKRASRYDEPEINFHGLTLCAELPSVSFVFAHDEHFMVKIDVVHCPDLKLVLPDRKSVVSNDFFRTLKQEATRVLYRAIAALPLHHLSYRDWRKAQDLGVTFAEAEPVLRPFTPHTADRCGRNPLAASVLPQNALVFDHDDAPLDQCLYRALEAAGETARLVEADSSYEGYAWYDGLARIEAVEWRITHDGAVQELEDYAYFPDTPRPDAIHARLSIKDAERGSHFRQFEADVAFVGDPYVYFDEVEPIVTKSSKISPGDLSVLIFDSFFDPSDDAGADSYETQRDRATEDAEEIAINLLISREAADMAAIRNELFTHVTWRFPKDRKTVITHEGSRLKIVYRPLGVRERFRRFRQYTRPLVDQAIKRVQSKIRGVRRRGDVS